MLKSNASTVNKNQIGIPRKTLNPKIWPFSGDQSKDYVHDNVISPLDLIPGKPKPIKAFLPANEVINRRNPPENGNRESLHRVISPILATAQLFGLLPLSGGVAAATAGVFFYGNALCGTTIFWWLAPRWVNLQKEWRLMEQQLDSNKQQTPRLQWKFRMITIMVMILALLEHVISIINNIPENQLPQNGVNATWKDYLELYTHNSHGFILSSCRYSIALGIFLFFVSKIATFTWNFTDLFIMLISTALAERYKTLNNNINTATLNHSNVDWSEFRKNYACLSTLVKRTDDDISPVILLSFVNNLYFICLQLLNGLSPGDQNLLGSLYFFGSFGFLLGRTIAVTLLTARINDQSKIALPVLYNCPALNYNIETQRLQLQLTTDDVALTGLRFFSITRNFMLAVGGAIVTYEVVLLQFNVAMRK
ncbi:hypothetical protein PV327_005715 [Microctonus hyperodae]|uniref:Gustatory receptor n=1 Tax=Microctonus hyperodae TaxID=165561 RepID=A0AA39G1Y2_MICHY|nr:hypothetical protein PV327_005715 [Microctonus hyperodae]